MRDYSTGRLPKSETARNEMSWFAILHKLINAGNTLVVVEHNLNVIKSADWVIDSGPEGGAADGQIIAEGRPGQVIKVATSHAGQFLAQALRPQPN